MWPICTSATGRGGHFFSGFAIQQRNPRNAGEGKIFWSWCENDRIWWAILGYMKQFFIRTPNKIKMITLHESFIDPYTLQNVPLWGHKNHFWLLNHRVPSWKLHLPSIIPHCIWASQPTQKESQRCWDPQLFFHPTDSFSVFLRKKKTKKNTTLFGKKNSLLLPLLYFQKKDLLEILRYLDPKGKLSTAIPSLYKLASSNPHPQVPRTIASSVTSRCESLCFLLVSTVSTRKEAQSSWGIFTTYQQVHQTYPRSKSKSFAPIQLVPNQKKKHRTGTSLPALPWCCRWDLPSRASVGFGFHGRLQQVFQEYPIPQKKEKWGGKKYVLI